MVSRVVCGSAWKVHRAWGGGCQKWLYLSTHKGEREVPEEDLFLYNPSPFSYIRLCRRRRENIRSSLGPRRIKCPHSQPGREAGLVSQCYYHRNLHTLGWVCLIRSSSDRGLVTVEMTHHCRADLARSIWSHVTGNFNITSLIYFFHLYYFFFFICGFCSLFLLPQRTLIAVLWHHLAPQRRHTSARALAAATAVACWAPGWQADIEASVPAHPIADFFYIWKLAHIMALKKRSWEGRPP